MPGGEGSRACPLCAQSRRMTTLLSVLKRDEQVLVSDGCDGFARLQIVLNDEEIAELSTTATNERTEAPRARLPRDEGTNTRTVLSLELYFSPSESRVSGWSGEPCCPGVRQRGTTSSVSPPRWSAPRYWTRP